MHVEYFWIHIISMSPNEAADLIFGLYAKFGTDDYIGEPVSQLEHMSQTAGLAIQDGCDDEVVLAAFFHDIGHLCVPKNQSNDMNGLGVISHERVGAEFLRELGFSSTITYLVDSHVLAKRYLCFKDSGYMNRLSEASRVTLMLQGGPMSPQEALDFEAHPLYKSAIRLRKWDDQAKLERVPIIDLEVLRIKVLNVLTRG